MGVLNNMEPCPQLEELYVVDGEVSGPDRPTFHPPSAAPLRRLSLYGVSFDTWRSWPFSSMETLSLAWQHDKGPNAGELHAMLSGSPNLKQLILRNWSQDSGATSASFSEFSLPNLRMVVAVAISESVLQVLRRLRAPNCHHLRMPLVRRGDIPWVLTNSQHALKEQVTGFAIIYTPTQYGADVSFSSLPTPDYEFTWKKSVNYVPGLVFSVPAEYTEEAWKQTHSRIPASSLPLALNITIEGSLASLQSPPFPWSAFASQPYVESITLRSDNGAADLFKYLSEPQANDDGGEHWPYYRLSTMNLRGCSGGLAEVVLGCLIARYEATWRAESIDSTPEDSEYLPIRLMSIEIPIGPDWIPVKEFLEEEGVDVFFSEY